jgi:hypothetical protein
VSDSVSDPKAQVVKDGHSIERYGMTCRTRTGTLRCANTHGHGFFLSRAAQRVF